MNVVNIRQVKGCVYGEDGSPLDNVLTLSLTGDRLNKLRLHGYEVIKRYGLKGVPSHRVAVIGLCDLLN